MEREKASEDLESNGDINRASFLASRKCPKHGIEVIATLDFETDPFETGAEIKPFCCGLWDGTTYYQWWGDDCHDRLGNHLRGLDENTFVYAHNGGRFDFTFLLPYLEPDVIIISNRIVVCRVGKCELRDSYAILPVPLKTAGEKGEIDYAKMRRDVRDRNRVEILSYLKQDCIALRDAVLAYRDRFGSKITMAGAAMAEVDKRVAEETGRKAKDTLQCLTMDKDADIRQYYFGGRVEAMERGIIRHDWNVYDMTSMYPFVMKRYEHPVSNRYDSGVSLDRCDFATIDATSKGAFPYRMKDGSLSFPHGRAVFHVSGHELRTAIDLSLCEIHSTIRTIGFRERRSFSEFVDYFFALRLTASLVGDETGKLHYKLVLNSSYGRFALNPDRLKQWLILPNGSNPDEDDHVVFEQNSVGETHTFWCRPVSEIDKRRAIRNVGTGASITGASRAELLRALHKAERPIYCDTDSIICEGADIELGTNLGQWKTEAQADEAAIAGKKLYALFKGGEAVKTASKGVRLTAEEIRQVASGEIVQWVNDKPTMGLAGQQRYMKRTVRRSEASNVIPLFQPAVPAYDPFNANIPIVRRYGHL